MTLPQELLQQLLLSPSVTYIKRAALVLDQHTQDKAATMTGTHFPFLTPPPPPGGHRTLSYPSPDMRGAQNVTARQARLVLGPGDNVTYEEARLIEGIPKQFWLKAIRTVTAAKSPYCEYIPPSGACTSCQELNWPCVREKYHSTVDEALITPRANAVPSEDSWDCHEAACRSAKDIDAPVRHNYGHDDSGREDSGPCDEVEDAVTKTPPGGGKAYRSPKLKCISCTSGVHCSFVSLEIESPARSKGGHIKKRLLLLALDERCASAGPIPGGSPGLISIIMDGILAPRSVVSKRSPPKELAISPTPYDGRPSLPSSRREQSSSSSAMSSATTTAITTPFSSGPPSASVRQMGYPGENNPFFSQPYGIPQAMVDDGWSFAGPRPGTLSRSEVGRIPFLTATKKIGPNVKWQWEKTPHPEYGGQGRKLPWFVCEPRVSCLHCDETRDQCFLFDIEAPPPIPVLSTQDAIDDDELRPITEDDMKVVPSMLRLPSCLLCRQKGMNCVWPVEGGFAPLYAIVYPYDKQPSSIRQGGLVDVTWDLSEVNKRPNQMSSK